MKRNQLQNFPGFTLIEILIVVGVLGVIVGAGSTMFFSVLRGSTKTKVLQMVKQNGDYAISVMERMIRNARSISGGGSSITIVNPDGGTTTFNCCGSNPNFLIASESGTLRCEEARITSSEVKVNNCSNVFEVTPGILGLRPAVVKINFDLSRAEQAGVTFRPEEQAVVNFQTTVSLRNY